MSLRFSGSSNSPQFGVEYRKHWTYSSSRNVSAGSFTRLALCCIISFPLVHSFPFFLIFPTGFMSLEKVQKRVSARMALFMAENLYPALLRAPTACTMHFPPPRLYKRPPMRLRFFFPLFRRKKPFFELFSSALAICRL